MLMTSTICHTCAEARTLFVSLQKGGGERGVGTGGLSHAQLLSSRITLSEVPVPEPESMLHLSVHKTKPLQSAGSTTLPQISLSPTQLKKT